MSEPSKKKLMRLYDALFKYFGPSGWWPAQTRFEVIVGAVLTQNTAWPNVERAIANLKRKRLVAIRRLDELTNACLAKLIRPAGYFNVKANRLKKLVRFIVTKYNGDISKMSREPLAKLREELLGVDGVGPETADSILLYALDKPIFVIDAYTKRILSRHGLIGESCGYSDVQRLFMENIPQRASLFNEYHALIVRTAKEFCRAKPRCEMCPVATVLGPAILI